MIFPGNQEDVLHIIKDLVKYLSYGEDAIISLYENEYGPDPEEWDPDALEELVHCPECQQVHVIRAIYRVVLPGEVGA